jgi:hypothetical protein
LTDLREIDMRTVADDLVLVQVRAASVISRSVRQPFAAWPRLPTMKVHVLLIAASLASLAACTPAVGGIAVPVHIQAGPVCPVERIPPDPACADRPVPGAELVVTDASGQRIARGRSNAAGDLSLSLPPGSYTLTPQPVSGVMGTAAPMTITVVAGASPAAIVVIYDTGIR